MKTNIKVSIHIIIVFIIAIAMSLVPDLYPNFFGDWLCVGHFNQNVGCLVDGNLEWSSFHNPTWHWGYRHYLWFFMGLCLFILQVAEIIRVLYTSESTQK